MACAVKEDTLTNMVSCMSETTGLVHQMPFVCDREGFSGVLEKVLFDLFFTRGTFYLSCNAHNSEYENYSCTVILII